MAKRRCISVDFYDSERFCELPLRAKHLYTELILHSDDKGVVINPKAVLRICKCAKNVLEFLVEENFLLKIDGLYIIRHWYVHNKVQPTRMVDSIYGRALSKLYINDAKEYCFLEDDLSTNCQHNINKLNINKINSSDFNSTEANLTEENINEPNLTEETPKEETGWSIASPEGEYNKESYNEFLDKLCNGYTYKPKN